MRKSDLDEYSCYETRAKVRMKPDDPKVVVKDVKEDEPSPFRPTDNAAA